MMMRPVLAAFVSLAVLAGCTGQQPGPKTTGGTLVGAAAGGLVGSQFGGGGGKAAMTGLGVLLGGILGSQVGQSLDRADQLYMEQTTQRSLESSPSGQASQWRNPDTGDYGTVVSQAAITNPQGQYCREYEQTVTVGGRKQQAYGTACRQPDGTWKLEG